MCNIETIEYLIITCLQSFNRLCHQSEAKTPAIDFIFIVLYKNWYHLNCFSSKFLPECIWDFRFLPALTQHIS